MITFMRILVKYFCFLKKNYLNTDNNQNKENLSITNINKFT